jgi:ABC-2 type transport system permease protein
MSASFCITRCAAMVRKELSQLSRDGVTLIMQFVIPVIQLLLLGYAIDFNPRHLPAAIVSADHSVITREIMSELENTSYFKFTHEYDDIKQANYAMQSGEVLFVVRIPPNFTADFFHHNVPEILVEADNSSPVAVASGLSAIEYLQYHSLGRILHGPLQQYRETEPSFKFIQHAMYNPDDVTAYGIVPGLIPLTVFILLISMASLTIVREREAGTMESLLVKPITPAEILIGKMMPYFIIGWLQVVVLLIFSEVLYEIPFEGSVLVYLVALLPFLFSGLAIGILISSCAKNQLQSMQLTMFIYLPNVVLTGFAFPFAGMPMWARIIGNIFPSTHFIRISRGIMLKGNGWAEFWPDLWPILLFTVIAIGLAIVTYRKQLD